MAEIELFSARVCPFAQRSRIALMEKGVKVQLIEIDLGNKPDWFSQISPYGKRHHSPGDAFRSELNSDSRQAMNCSFISPL